MNVFTVSLFGHREIDDLRRLDELLEKLIREIIESNAFVSFLIGRNGEFDVYSASVIKRVRKEINGEGCELTLVLPYTVSDIEYYEKYYDSIIIPESVFNAFHKTKIIMRNRWMVERSDLIIAYVERRGGAYDALKYAESLGKKAINLCNLR